MMQAKRGIKEHGHAIELGLARRKWTGCTDAAKVSHWSGGLVERGRDFDLISDHMHQSCMKHMQGQRDAWCDEVFSTLGDGADDGVHQGNKRND